MCTRFLLLHWSGGRHPEPGSPFAVLPVTEQCPIKIKKNKCRLCFRLGKQTVFSETHIRHNKVYLSNQAAVLKSVHFLRSKWKFDHILTSGCLECGVLIKVEVIVKWRISELKRKLKWELVSEARSPGLLCHFSYLFISYSETTGRHTSRRWFFLSLA